MFNFKISVLIVFGLNFCYTQTKSELTKISVMMSHSYKNEIENRALQRLDLKIIENFGKKFKLAIEFFATNKTLNEVFSAETDFLPFLQADGHS